jgi:integrase/recombinase XerD
MIQLSPKWTSVAGLRDFTSGIDWLTVQSNLGLAENTIFAYARALGDFLQFCRRQAKDALRPNLEDISLYVRHLNGGREPTAGEVGTRPPLSNATIQQRLTALRLFYDYLVEQGTLQANPVGRGHHRLRRPVGEVSIRGLVPRYRTLPWIPSEDEWSRLLQTARTLDFRNRFMFLFSYDCALRREELCSLRTSDLDPALRTVRIRGETTKSRSDRVLPFSQASAQLLNQYLQERRRLTRAPGRLLISTSNRNAGQPITKWAWSKVVRDIALRAQVPKFSTHSFRHLCLTDLARAGWDLKDIAHFAGHRSLQSTLLYLHLSARHLTERFESAMSAIHSRRLTAASEILQ